MLWEPAKKALNLRETKSFHRRGNIFQSNKVRSSSAEDKRASYFQKYSEDPGETEVDNKVNIVNIRPDGKWL